MNSFQTKNHHPEKTIEIAIRNKLSSRGWFVIKTHGNAFQSGLPDLYATHSKYGVRWIEVKTPTGTFTPAQRDTFPKMSANGSPIWVLTSADDYELQKLFGPENWFWFLKG